MRIRRNLLVLGQMQFVMQFRRETVPNNIRRLFFIQGRLQWGNNGTEYVLLACADAMTT